MKLYDYELSGNCYKVRLFLSILGLNFDTKPVDFYPGCEHKSKALLSLNPHLGNYQFLKIQMQFFVGQMSFCLILLKITTNLGFGILKNSA